MSNQQQVTLSGVEVIHGTESAILVAFTDAGEDKEQWIPRSLCLDGDTLEDGDKDIVVDRWFAMKKCLPWED